MESRSGWGVWELTERWNKIFIALKWIHEKRAGQIKEPKGAKTKLIEAAIRSLKSGFTVSDLEKSCPTVSRDMIRRVLHDLKKAKKVECGGRGPGATWRQKG